MAHSVPTFVNFGCK